MTPTQFDLAVFTAVSLADVVSTYFALSGANAKEAGVILRHLGRNVVAVTVGAVLFYVLLGVYLWQTFTDRWEGYDRRPWHLASALVATAAFINCGLIWRRSR